MLKLAVVVRDGRAKVPKAFLAKWVKLTVRELLKSKELSIARKNQLRSATELTAVFVSTAEIQKLNKLYRKRNEATDILSFESVEDGSLGELVVSLAVLRKQAKDHGLTLNEELGYMILHGVLHLLGLDHEGSQAEAKSMFRLQDRVFDRLIEKDVE